ncbi:MAG: ribulokinase [Treponema sp.]|jgi:L-ribulokinase|nr:ribulokinase [Treponema sp.]
MKYSIGIDYGTLTSRAILVEVGKHKIIAHVEKSYPHGVMEKNLPTGTKLGVGWAVQDGCDYYAMLTQSIRDLLQETSVSPDDVIGIGIDTTACTILPLDENFEPLSSNASFVSSPNAYVKLWKHHAAQPYADELNRIAANYNMNFLSHYGGKISSEWMIPKIMQIAAESPDIYNATKCFSEIADWLVYKLCGKFIKSNVMAGYKALWNEQEGYPNSDFFAALNPIMKDIVSTKLSQPIVSIGNRAGFLTKTAAHDTGLTMKTAVAVAHTDAGVVPFGIGMHKAGQMVMSIGTSTCHFLLGDIYKPVPGICGVVNNGSLPGFYSYEAGQAAVGDIFNWFARSYSNADLRAEASRKKCSVFALLAQKASKLAVGENGLVLLDWLNGNRTVLVDSDLSGALVGLDLHTTPEEIYRSLLEGTAFGTKKIIDTFEYYGIPVEELFACGGIPKKDPFMMQIYADVCNRTIHVPDESLAAAYGASVLGAAAADKKNGGFDSVMDAVRTMACKKETVYKPIPENVARYAQLFDIYNELHDFFGIKSPIMKRLRKMRMRNIHTEGEKNGNS